MSAQNDGESNTDSTLKPELAFEWIKYKKEKNGKKVTADDLAKYISQKKIQQKQLKEEEDQKYRKAEEKIDLVKEETTPVKLSFKSDDFKGEIKKERIALWCEAIVIQKEITMEELSKALNIPDLIELEDFLFRFPPLKFSYSWRGKNLKFTNESLEKLQELLKEEL